MTTSIQPIAAIHDADAAILRGHVVQCTRAAFAAYSVHVDLDAGDPYQPAHDAQIVAFIGFGGARMRGTLTVVAPHALWRETYPIVGSAGSEPDDNDLLDWCGEVVNQVLGRIKNQLLRSGVELQVSTPKALRASQLTISTSAQKTVCVLRSSATDGTSIGVWFDAMVEESGILFPSPSEALPSGDVADSMNEGDALLF
ncbi:MAG: chemotaxis protein CheX [Byssovorax sp.]